MTEEFNHDPTNKIFESIEERVNMFQRDLSQEVKYFSLFKGGLKSRIGNDVWFVQLNEENRLTLSSTSDYIDISREVSSEEEIMNEQTLVFDDKVVLGNFSVRGATIVNQDINIGTSCRRKTVVSTTGIINNKYETNKTYKFRTVILQDERLLKISFQYYFAHFIADQSQCMCIGIKTNKYIAVFQGVSFSYDKKRFIVYYYSEHINSPTYYFVIESLDALTYKDYIAISDKVLSVIGFFTRIYPLGPNMVFDCSSERPYLFAYNNCNIKPRVARYTMQTLNSFAYYLDKDIHKYYLENNTDEKEMHRKRLSVEEKLRPIEKRHFEMLLKQLDDKEFSNMFYTLQEVSTIVLGGSTYNPMVNLILYAACLEESAKWFQHSVKPSKTNKTALLSKDARKKIIDGLSEILDQIEGEDPEDIAIIWNKIRSNLFNKPNADNLIEPFEYFNIKLNEEDKNLFVLRNKILHGTDIIESKFDLDNVLPYVMESERYCFGFYSLLWRLIMKSIGYTGVYRDEVQRMEQQINGQSNNGKPFIKDI